MECIRTSEYVAQPSSELLMTSYKSLNLPGSILPPLQNERIESKVGPSAIKISEALEGKAEPLPA